jgi:hypothetical protein
MLNCTDTECILHHDHYYQHLHQLQQMQHHLQDHREHHGELININVTPIFKKKKKKKKGQPTNINFRSEAVRFLRFTYDKRFER